MKTEIKDGQLIITIDVSEKTISGASVSKSGRSKVVASTGGFIVVGDNLRLNLNLITK